MGRGTAGILQGDKAVFARIIGMSLTALLTWALLVIPTAAPASAAPDSYAAPYGVRFNDPYSRRNAKDNIRTHIVRTINSTEAGSTIRFASWNLRGPFYRNALIAAHRRGVTVRIIMDQLNHNAEFPNDDIERMIEAFSDNTLQGPDPARHSRLTRCVSSCRGQTGIAHLKLFLFEQAGGIPHIVMWGSNNATDVAVHSQWNDLFTLTFNQPAHDALVGIFNELEADTPTYGAYRHFDVPGFSFDVYPYTGNFAWGDPDLDKLNRTRCQGTTDGAGYRGRTVIRMAQDALLGERGKAIAYRLAQMKRRGCNIRIVYALMGGPIKRILTKAGVPLRQYSYDRDRDGYYDIYLHMKSLAISGVYNGQTNARVTFNGTANWSPVALVSDELVGTVVDPGVNAAYIRWIDYLYNNRPKGWTSTNLAPVEYETNGGVEGRRAPHDPWALVKASGL